MRQAYSARGTAYARVSECALFSSLCHSRVLGNFLRNFLSSRDGQYWPIGMSAICSVCRRRFKQKRVDDLDNQLLNLEEMVCVFML